MAWMKREADSVQVVKLFTECLDIVLGGDHVTYSKCVCVCIYIYTNPYKPYNDPNSPNHEPTYEVSLPLQVPIFTPPFSLTDLGLGFRWD